jgi:hypothetical protein
MLSMVMFGCRCPCCGVVLAAWSTYLWIELVDATDGVVDVAALDGSSDDHAVEDAFRVDEWLEAALPAKAVGGILVALDDEVVHDEPVEIAVVN